MDISKLQRYNAWDEPDNSKNGKYVLYKDVQKLINKNKKVVKECATCKYYNYNNVPANGIALCNFCISDSKWEPNNV